MPRAAQWRLANRFIVGYSGNLGRAHEGECAGDVRGGVFAGDRDGEVAGSVGGSASVGRTRPPMVLCGDPHVTPIPPFAHQWGVDRIGGQVRPTERANRRADLSANPFVHSCGTDGGQVRPTERAERNHETLALARRYNAKWSERRTSDCVLLIYRRNLAIPRA